MMLSLTQPTTDTEATRRKSCPAYHYNSTTAGSTSPRPSPQSTPIRSCSTTERIPANAFNRNDQSKVQVHKALHRFEDELKRAFTKVRHAGTNIKDRISPVKDGEEDKPSFPDPLERTLQVVYASLPSKKYSKHNSSLADLIEADQSCETYDEVNANPALTLESLANGCFSASIMLNRFPPAGDIIIRISGYKLDFYWVAHRPKSSSRRSNHVYNHKPIYCNAVDLPMYVDPLNLELHLVHDSMISVMGQTKGFMSRRKSISSEDLSIDNFFTKSPRLGKKKEQRTRKHSPAMLLEDFANAQRLRVMTF